MKCLANVIQKLQLHLELELEPEPESESGLIPPESFTLVIPASTEYLLGQGIQ